MIHILIDKVIAITALGSIMIGILIAELIWVFKIYREKL